MLLSEDHLAVQDAVRTYVQAEITPHAAAWDKSHQFPAAQLQGLARWVVTAWRYPPSGTAPGWTTWRWQLILEEIAAGDGATSTVVSVNNCPVCSILMAFGNADRKSVFSSRWRAARCWAPSA